MQTQFVKPAPGRLVRFEDPSLGHIPPEGEAVALTKYYRRRIAVGDLVPAKVPRPPKADKTKE